MDGRRARHSRRIKEVNLKTTSIVAYLLIGLGFLFTFPPFFVLFAA